MSTNTQKLQGRIYKEYGQEQIGAEVERICKTCNCWHYSIITKSGHCKGNLVPITSKGEPCPYYEKLYEHIKKEAK